MIIPSGTKLIVDGGTFTGDFSGDELTLKNNVTFTGSVANVPVMFEGTLTLSGDMSISGTNVEFEDLTVSGTLNIDSSYVTGNTLNVSGDLLVTNGYSFNVQEIETTGTSDISSEQIYGVEWQVTSLTTTDPIDIQKLSAYYLLISASETSNVSDLTVSIDLTINSPLIVESLTANLCDTIEINGVDTFLTVKENAILSDINITGNGYLALASSIDHAELIVGENVKVCEYGAGITAFVLETGEDATAKAKITRTDSTKTFLIEKRLGDEESYEVINLACDENEVEIETEIGSPNVVRVFDGLKFWSDVSYVYDIPNQTQIPESDYYVYTLGNFSFNNTTKPFRNEPLVFLGQIQNRDTNAPIKRSEVDKVFVTVYRYSNYQYSSANTTEVPRWTNVEIDKRCFFEEPKAFDIWDKGGNCNFCWIPNQNIEAFASNSGKYAISFKAELLTGTSTIFSLTFEVL